MMRNYPLTRSLVRCLSRADGSAVDAPSLWRTSPYTGSRPATSTFHEIPNQDVVASHHGRNEELFLPRRVCPDLPE